MNDIRRTILWVVFGFAMVLLWDKWQVYNGHKATFFPAPGVASAPAAPAPATAAPGAASVPGGAGGTAVAPGAPAADSTEPGELVEVTTDVYKATFDTRGATLVRLELLHHADQDDHARNVVLFDRHEQHTYVAQTGLIGGPGLPTHLSLFRFVGPERALADGKSDLALRFESANGSGVTLVKTYTLHRGSYLIDVRHDVANATAAAIKPELYLQLMRDGTVKGNTNMFAGPTSYTGFAFYTDKSKFKKVDFAAIEKGKAEFEKTADDGWVAMVQHYFVSAWLDTQSAPREFFAKRIENNLYGGGMRLALAEIAPGASTSVSAQLYAGPQEEKKLEAIAPGLELVKDYGIFTILAKPLYWLLDKIHGVLQNWGWSIVALVVMLKIAFYWLNAKAYSSMAKMKAINPKIMEMRERLKDKPQQMQQEMMRIYREEKVNPMGGCLPIVVQIPFFISLYWVLLSTVEMRNAPWILWVKDLSTPDPLFILPLLMTASSLLQTWLNPTPPDPMQAKLMWIMPLAFSVMFFFFPAGLVLYWLTNNLLSIAQQWVINKRLGVLGK
ncbi:membrane protein insertase YidC [Ramlibacter sp. H39-3-26]|uniref:membrane protein insertase YidC n=1 Tax=Curvibacter soli TaxID=3031331 RepID=UPI0023D9A970|nr:membrane protein insertase YidC [Ramlibacter sp. H39-3-26]MDF1486323.1 membrane protein insertase YidC [Ramlibacter sp. H39-3-26]